MNTILSDLLFLLASVGFILALRGLGSIPTAARGNWLGIGAMALSIAVIMTTLDSSLLFLVLVGIAVGGGLGGFIALRAPMMALPQLMAAFHSLVGLAAVLISAATLSYPVVFGLSEALSSVQGVEMGLGATIGALTFTGSVIAYFKLQGSKFLNLLRPFMFCVPRIRNILAILWLTCFVFFILAPEMTLLMTLISIGSLLGVFLVLPIGGADMPVVVSMLNSYSGWAAAGIGFTLSNPLLIIVGALVGSSGAVLSYVMCVGMNRPFLQVIFGAAPTQSTNNNSSADEKPFKQGTAEDAAFLLRHARRVMVVPGYGMAVAQSQHALREMVDLLEKENVRVQFAIHPVAGRMPGHMNVLLAESGVPYESVHELEEINGDFPQIDVAFVIGANDITNTAAKTDSQSPLYGMPILDVGRAQTVLFVKRSMGAGYAGVDNPVFYQDNTLMLLGDAKRICELIVSVLRDA